MAIPERVKTKMKEEGLSGVNKPKRTPNHKTARHDAQGKPTSKLSAKYWSHKVKW